MRFGRKKRALILGCGPSGLFAAHALEENGWDIRIYSKKRKSHIYGAQYLHSPIPGLTPEGIEPIWVKYILNGSAEVYREKVYGAMPVNTSVEALDTEHMAWDLRATYDAAWERWSERVIPVQVDRSFMGAPLSPGEDASLTIDYRRWDVVLSSIPLNQICYRNHQFHSAEVWALGDAPDRGQLAPYRPAENTVECNGTFDSAWYRASNVYGHVTMEWPGNRKPPLQGVAAVTKPIYTDCDCYGKNVIHIGRYGSWKKSVLTHHAYTQAAQL